ncbi:rho GTPase-activating protein 2-like [Senna tora]|uniref:Rho GTPase-activating protein 2-like n=1 Tax=Senna tora TaxID=362788 RepID=A0A834U2X0_9FABA|nr:rho GTPase-activating protein 2-like [Senna tora]
MVDRHFDVISIVHHMEIGWPTNVQHITHVTFDRFNGFLVLPVEFEVEIPGHIPSARNREAKATEVMVVEEDRSDHCRCRGPRETVVDRRRFDDLRRWWSNDLCCQHRWSVHNESLAMSTAPDASTLLPWEAHHFFSDGA